jgi:hypothetical protein
MTFEDLYAEIYMWSTSEELEVEDDEQMTKL